MYRKLLPLTIERNLQLNFLVTPHPVSKVRFIISLILVNPYVPVGCDMNKEIPSMERARPNPYANGCKAILVYKVVERRAMLQIEWWRNKLV